MKPLKLFDDFLNLGVIRRTTPNAARANSLMEEAEKRKKFLDELRSKMDISDENANYFIEPAYDVLIELIRAKLLIDGFSSSGEGAHEAEVAYMRTMGFSEAETRFMNDLRYYRNSVKYYGKDLDKNYGLKVLAFLNVMYPKLKAIVK